MGDPVTVVATVEKIGAGSVVEFSFDDGTTFKKIPGVESIPQVGTEGSFQQVTSIDETVHRFASSMKTPPEWDFPFKDIADDADQQLLIDAADAGDTVKVKVTYANGRVADFNLVLSGHYAAEAEIEGVLMHAVKGQISGDPVWSKVA